MYAVHFIEPDLALSSKVYSIGEYFQKELNSRDGFQIRHN